MKNLIIGHRPGYPVLVVTYSHASQSHRCKKNQKKNKATTIQYKEILAQYQWQTNPHGGHIQPFPYLIDVLQEQKS